MMPKAVKKLSGDRPRGPWSVDKQGVLFDGTGEWLADLFTLHERERRIIVDALNRDHAEREGTK